MSKAWPLAALACALVQPGSAGTVPLACDTERELMSGLDFIREVCTQTGESFSGPHNPVPTTCASSQCKAAVDRVARDCGPLMASDGFFLTRQTLLSAAVATCEAAPAPSATHVVGYPKPPNIVSCRGELSGRAGGSGTNYRQEVTIDAGPSGGKVLLDFGTHVLGTLVLAVGDILTAYDGRDCDDDLPWLAQLRGTAKPAAPLVSSGRFMCVKLITNDQHAASSFSAEISCRCEDSAAWSVDHTGSNCSAFARGALGSLFDTCEKQGENPDTEGVTVPDSRGVSQTLDAKQACPLACEACDACSSSPCENGGTCTAASTAAPAHRHLQQGTCATAKMSSSTAAINVQCCGVDDAECAGGLPTSCDPGCAAVFLPFWASCGSAMQGAADYSGVVALCRAQVADEQASGFQCACAQGWSGTLCTEPSPCDSSPCGAHGSCVAQGGGYSCSCEAGWSGSTCAKPTAAYDAQCTKP